MNNPTNDISFSPVEKKEKEVPPIEDILKVTLASEPDEQDYLYALRSKQQKKEAHLSTSINHHITNLSSPTQTHYISYSNLPLRDLSTKNHTHYNADIARIHIFLDSS
jgi:hypothetical protein